MFVVSVAITTEKANTYLILMADECIYLDAGYGGEAGPAASHHLAG
jgi:hypothetical protein